MIRDNRPKGLCRFAIELDLANSPLRAARTAMEHRAEDMLPKKRYHSHRLEKLASLQFGCAVVQPNPSSLLEPFWRTVRPVYYGRVEYVRNHGSVAGPENFGSLNEMLEIGQNHELEINMKKLWSIEADEQARLAYVIAGEGRKKVAEASRNLSAFSQDLGIGITSYDRHKIDIRVLVKATVHQRTARKQPFETVVQPQFFNEGFEEGGMQ